MTVNREFLPKTKSLLPTRLGQHLINNRPAPGGNVPMYDLGIYLARDFLIDVGLPLGSLKAVYYQS